MAHIPLIVDTSTDAEKLAHLMKFYPAAYAVVNRIRADRTAGISSVPSKTLIDESQILTREFRAKLLDQVSTLVNRNWCGRSEMCFQFAELLSRALNTFGLKSRVAIGKGIYFSQNGCKVFEWEHAWVRVDDEVIDGNIDSISDNPMLPVKLTVPPFWGPIRNTPKDRHLRETKGAQIMHDPDIVVWWQELEKWLIDNPPQTPLNM